MAPAAYYMGKTHFYNSHLKKNLIGYTMEGYKNYYKKLIFFMSCGTAALINSQIYQYNTGFNQMMTEMKNIQRNAMDNGRLISGDL